MLMLIPIPVCKAIGIDHSPSREVTAIGRNGCVCDCTIGGNGHDDIPPLAGIDKLSHVFHGSLARMDV